MFESPVGTAAFELPLEWSRYAPDGMLADLLVDAPEVTPPAPMHPDDAGFEILERIGAWEKIISWAQANQLSDMVRFVRHSGAHRPPGVDDDDAAASTNAEIGLVLRISRRAADQRVSTATDLVQRLPAVHAALHSGTLSLPAARVLAEETVHLPAAQARAVAEVVLPVADERTAGQLRVSARRAVLKADPQAARRRCEQAAKERGVWLQDELDGMASLHARLPAADALGCYAVLDELARRAQGPGAPGSGAPGSGAPGTGTPRSGRPGMDARRADAFVDLVCGTDLGRVAVQIRVVVPFTTLLGLDDRPGELAGYGPVPADVARRLAADATWRRILTDAPTGTVLEVGRTGYRPPAQLAELVVTRDRTCRHPGCRVPAQRCDLDHTRPFDAVAGSGPTIVANLAACCRAHHRLKHQPGWTVVQEPDATVTWTTPSGHSYRTRPPPPC